MPKFKKGNTYGLKSNCVPYYNGVNREKSKSSPALYVRLSNKLDEIVGEAPTPSERQEKLLWPDSYYFLLPRGLKRKITY